MVASTLLAGKRIYFMLVLMALFSILTTPPASCLKGTSYPEIRSCVAGCMVRNSCIFFVFNSSTLACDYRRTIHCWKKKKSNSNDNLTCLFLENGGFQMTDNIRTGIFKKSSYPAIPKQCPAPKKIKDDFIPNPSKLGYMSCGSYLLWNGGSPASVCYNMGLWTGDMHGCSGRFWKLSSSSMLFELQSILSAGSSIHVSGSSQFREQLGIYLKCTNQYIALLFDTVFLNDGKKVMCTFKSKKKSWVREQHKTFFGVSQQDFSITVNIYHSGFQIQVGSDPVARYRYSHEVDITTVNVVQIVSNIPLDHAKIIF